MSRNFLLLALLLLTSCITLTPAEIPTAFPTFTLTPTIIPSPTPTLTPTPDPFAEIINGLKDKGINASREDGQWKILFQGAQVPNTSMDENGLHIEGIGDVPLDQLSRLAVRDGILVLNAEDGGVIAGFGSKATKLEGKWFVESDVIGFPIVIGNTWDDSDNWIPAEKIFYKPFPPDVYYPDRSKIVKDYAYNRKDEIEPGFSERFPFGLIDKSDLDKSPFIPSVNVKILEPNEAEGRFGYTVIFAEQVHDPNDVSHIQELNHVDLDKVYKTLDEAKKAVNHYYNYKKFGLYMLPEYDLMREDFLTRYPRLQNLYLFLRRSGYLDLNGKVDQGRLHAMVISFLETGKISPECERVWWLVGVKTIIRRSD